MIVNHSWCLLWNLQVLRNALHAVEVKLKLREDPIVGLVTGRLEDIAQIRT